MKIGSTVFRIPIYPEFTFEETGMKITILLALSVLTGVGIVFALSTSSSWEQDGTKTSWSRTIRDQGVVKKYVINFYTTVEVEHVITAACPDSSILERTAWWSDDQKAWTIPCVGAPHFSKKSVRELTALGGKLPSHAQDLLNIAQTLARRTPQPFVTPSKSKNEGYQIIPSCPIGIHCTRI